MSEPAADMTLPRCWPPRQHERGPCVQLHRLCTGLVCSDPKAADPIGPSLKQNMAAAAVAGRADAAALRVAHAVAAVRVVVARVSPPSWCLISSVLHALHAVSRTSQVGPGCAAVHGRCWTRWCCGRAGAATRMCSARCRGRPRRRPHAGVVTHAGVDRRRRDGG